MIKVMECTCAHEYQDKKYGKNKRVFNACGRDQKRPDWKCTVCAKVKGKL